MTRAFVPTLLILLLATAGSAPAVGPDADLRPYVIDWTRAGESLVDNSRFLDAPAGKRGTVQAVGERLLFPDGTRLRIWGINVCGGVCFPDKEAAKLIAADFARLGFNCVRFHHMEAEWGRNIFVKGAKDTQTLDADSLDRLDFFIAELKARGIYVNLNLNVSRNFREGDGVRDHKALGMGKGATYFNPRLIELQQLYARQLLTHKNPYTGNEYRHEPAVAAVEIANENSLLEAWANWRLIGKDVEWPDTWSPLPVSYVEELTDLFNQWLGANVSAEELKQIRAEAGGDRVGLLRPDQFAKASKLRFHANARYLMGIEASFFDGMRKLLKDELGVRAPVVGSADHNDRTSGYPHIQALRQLDVVDGHGYWQHPEIGAATKSPNTPMVNDPLDSTVAQFARTPVSGKPFTITETNEPFPHEYACENYPILTAYAMLHDWDGVYWFDWGGGRLQDPKAGITPSAWFDVSTDPVKLTSIATCGSMWHRQDVRPSEAAEIRQYGPGQVVESLRLPREESPFFTPQYPRSRALELKTRSEFTPNDVELPVAYGKAASPGEILARTGQIGWYGADRKKGVVAIDTGRTQGLVGFVREGARETSQLAVEVRNDFCAILCTSLDGRAWGGSTRLLLSTTSRATNTGFRWTDDKERKTVAEWGRGPTLIEPVIGTVTLKDLGDAKAVTARPLTAEGRPQGPTVAGRRDGNRWQIPIGEHVTTWYVIDVER